MRTKDEIMNVIRIKDKRLADKFIELFRLRRLLNEIDNRELENDYRRMYPYIKRDTGNLEFVYKEQKRVLSWFDWKELKDISPFLHLVDVLDYLEIEYDDRREFGDLLRIFGTPSDVEDVIIICQKLYPGTIGGNYSDGTNMSNGRPFFATATKKI